MDIQTVITYIVVGLAFVFVIRTFIRQFSSNDTGCSTCSHCGPETPRESPQAAELIQVDIPEK